MPIMRCELHGGGTGYKWGEHGHCYPSRAEAVKQGQAIRASGWAGDAVLQKRTLKPVRPNAGLKAEYRRRLLVLVDEMNNSIMYWVTAAYRQNETAIVGDAKIISPVAELQKALAGLASQWLKKFMAGARKLAEWHTRKSLKLADRQLAESVSEAAGMSVNFQMTEGMQTAIDATIAEQVSLITSIAQQNLTQVETLVMQSVQTGRDLATLTDELETRYGITRRRAETIARDQNNKATATITRQRQSELGIKQAIWLHSHAGKKPRPSHVKADGSVYDVDKGMFLDGKWTWPGVEINCRCVSRSIIPELAELMGVKNAATK